LVPPLFPLCALRCTLVSITTVSTYLNLSSAITCFSTASPPGDSTGTHHLETESLQPLLYCHSFDLRQTGTANEVKSTSSNSHRKYPAWTTTFALILIRDSLRLSLLPGDSTASAPETTSEAMPPIDNGNRWLVFSPTLFGVIRECSALHQIG
jgi:hypothetical protein